MLSHPLNSEAGQQAIERAHTGPVIAMGRAARARRYEQLIADLENTDARTFVVQLMDALQGMTAEEEAKLRAAWVSNNGQLVDSILRDAHRQHLHMIAEANV